MIFSCDKIYDNKNCQSQNVRSPLIVKQERSLHSACSQMKQLEHIYVTKKQFRRRRKVQNLRIKFTTL